MAVNDERVTAARMNPSGVLSGVGHDPDDQEWHRDLDFNVYVEVSIRTHFRRSTLHQAIRYLQIASKRAVDSGYRTSVAPVAGW